jgi:transcriptional regulator with XRE-family HTH domain
MSNETKQVKRQRVVTDIAKRRKEAGLTQADVVAGTGLHAMVVGLIEAGNYAELEQRYLDLVNHATENKAFIELQKLEAEAEQTAKRLATLREQVASVPTPLDSVVDLSPKPKAAKKSKAKELTAV